MKSPVINTTDGIMLADPWASVILALAVWGLIDIVLFEVIEPLWWHLVLRKELEQETRQCG